MLPFAAVGPDVRSRSIPANHAATLHNHVPTKFPQHSVPNTVFVQQTANTVLATLRATQCSLFLRQHSIQQLHSVHHSDSALHAA
jgi:hypothetical protein